MTGLQLYNNGVAIVANNASILLNTIAVSTDTNISYNSGTGIVSFASAGTYYVSWSASVATSASSSGTIISLATSSATYDSGSDIKNSVITGSTILNATAGLMLTLVNRSGGIIKLAGDVPTNATLSIINAGNIVTAEGFSATISNVSVSSNTQFTNWTTTTPYFSSTSFNAISGIYTVPASGRYLVNATINYATNAVITASLGNNVNPAFAVTRTSPITATLLSSLLPVFNVNVALLTLRTILGSGSVHICGEVQLNSGDTVALQYQNSGLTLALNLGNGSGIFWSMQRIS